MVLTIHPGKAFDKIQHSLLIKTAKKKKKIDTG